MVCRKCKVEMKNTDQYCWHCGAPRGLTAAEMSERHRKRYGWLQYAVILMAIVLGVLVIYRYSQGNLHLSISLFGGQGVQTMQDQMTQQQLQDQETEEQLQDQATQQQLQYRATQQQQDQATQQQQQDQAMQQMQDQATQQQIQDQMMQQMQQMQDQITQQQLQDQMQQLQQMQQQMQQNMF